MPIPGPWELLIILAIVVVIFGAGKLPEIGSALGRSIRGFKEEVTDEEKKAAAEKAAAEKATLKADTNAVVKDETAARQ